MPRPVPFLFCRYNIAIDEETLGANAQQKILEDIQGKFISYVRSLERADTAIVRPRQLTVEGERALMWSVVRKVGERVTVDYDPADFSLHFNRIFDPTMHYADFIAIPRLSVIAIDDRSGIPHLGGKAAINRFIATFEELTNGKVEIEPTATASDVSQALDQWELTDFSFVVRPFNPHPPGMLAQRLSEDFQKDGIGRFRGKAQPFRGQRMRPADDAIIASVRELADDGYGQYSIEGVTSEGHTAKLKQPKFEVERDKNRRNQGEPRELRIVIDAVDSDIEESVFRHVVAALKNFYDRQAA